MNDPSTKSLDHESSDPEFERLFREAIAVAGAGRIAEAADMLDQAAERDQSYPNLWWNLGTFRAQLGQHPQALSVWDIYRTLVPEDWRARPKVIQACQALGDSVRRNRERAELLALHASGADPELSAEPRYCREQFRVGDQPVVAYETFEPADPQRVFYSFLVGGPDGRMIGQYSLGSYDSTTQLSRELGHIGPKGRIYHLDEYNAQGHRTYAFYNLLPSYDETRADVIAAITGALPAVSGITSSRGTGRADIYMPSQASVPGAIVMGHELGVVAAGGDASSPPPSAAPPRATRVSTTGRASGARVHPLARPTAWERFTAWLGHLRGRGTRPN